MDGLRWLLLIFGLLVIAGVYFYSRREREKPKPERADTPRFSPTIGDEPTIDLDQTSDLAEDAAEQTPQKIVTLRVVAKNKGAFPGDELILSLRGIGGRQQDDRQFGTGHHRRLRGVVGRQVGAVGRRADDRSGECCADWHRCDQSDRANEGPHDFDRDDFISLVVEKLEG